MNTTEGNPQIVRHDDLFYENEWRGEYLDWAKYLYLEALARLQAAADRVSVLAFDGDIIGDDERDRLHELIREVSDNVCCLYTRLSEHATDNLDELDAETYSDRSPTYATAPAVDHRDGAVYRGDIGWPHIQAGQRPVVARPPHLQAPRPEERAADAIEWLRDWHGRNCTFINLCDELWSNGVRHNGDTIIRLGNHEVIDFDGVPKSADPDLVLWNCGTRELAFIIEKMLADARIRLERVAVDYYDAGGMILLEYYYDEFGDSVDGPSLPAVDLGDSLDSGTAGMWLPVRFAYWHDEVAS